MPTIYDQIQETSNCDNCEKIHKWQIDIVRNMMTEHHRYNTIVCSLGYGTIITILNLVKDDISFTCKLWAIIPLIISIGIFVYVEMDNLAHIKLQIIRLTAIIYAGTNLDKIKQVYGEFYEDEQNRIKKFQVPRYISIATGFIAVIPLIVGIFS